MSQLGYDQNILYCTFKCCEHAFQDHSNYYRNYTGEMSIRSNTICLFLFLCATVTICQDVEQTSEEIPEDSDDESSIWMEYEFGTGAGNREGIEKLFQAKKKKKNFENNSPSHFQNSQ